MIQYLAFFFINDRKFRGLERKLINLFVRFKIYFLDIKKIYYNNLEKQHKIKVAY